MSEERSETELVKSNISHLAVVGLLSWFDSCIIGT